MKWLVSGIYIYSGRSIEAGLIEKRITVRFLDWPECKYISILPHENKKPHQPDLGGMSDVVKEVRTIQ